MKRIITSLILCSAVFATENHHNELSLGGAFTYLTAEKESAISIHLHYTRFFENNFGVGISYEEVSDKHGHSVLSGILSYRIEEIGLKVSYMPGFYTEGDGDLVHHIEVVKFFSFKGIHLGPMVGFSFGEEEHISVGLHAGFGF